MQSCLSSSVDLVKNVINKVARSRTQYRSSAALALSVQEHIASLCQKRVPICLDVFVSCNCRNSNHELFLVSPSKDTDCQKKKEGSVHAERWTFTFLCRRTSEGSVNDYELLSTINDCLQRSHFSTWLRSQNRKRPHNVYYRLGAPDEVSDMSTTDVSFAQVFPTVHVDRTTCMQTAMASFFNPNVAFGPGCQYCLVDQSHLLKENERDSSKANVCSNLEDTLIGSYSPKQLESQGKNITNNSSLSSGSSNSSQSSRSASPTGSVLPFGSLSISVVSTSTVPERQRLPNVALSCGGASSSMRVLDQSEIEKFISEVKGQPLDESDTALISGFGTDKSLSNNCTVQNQEYPKSINEEQPSRKTWGGFPVSRSLPLSTGSQRLVTADFQSPKKNITESAGRSPPSLSSGRFFNPSTGLPLHSSPAPLKRGGVRHFHFDPQLTNPRRIRTSFSGGTENGDRKFLPLSAKSSPLLGTFEESLLNGRIMPIGAVDGFKAELAASGSFYSPHITLPVTAYFFQLDEATHPWASPYLGVMNLRHLDKALAYTKLCPVKTRNRYHIPPKGTVQVTLFNPNRTVLKMFVVLYDLSDMPPSCTTFIRQRTLYMPVHNNNETCGNTSGAVSSISAIQLPVTTRSDTSIKGRNGAFSSFLRYLIHLRVASSSRGRIFLHSDIRLIFASDKFEFDSRIAAYEMRSFTEMPCNPKFSPRK